MSFKTELDLSYSEQLQKATVCAGVPASPALVQDNKQVSSTREDVTDSAVKHLQAQQALHVLKIRTTWARREYVALDQKYVHHIPFPSFSLVTRIPLFPHFFFF